MQRINRDDVSYKIMPELPDSKIAATLAAFGVAASGELCRAIREYTSLLLLWNQKISLTGITSPAEILERHFAESLFAVSAAPIRARRLADVGSGAGFPGLALGLLLPNCEVTLIEANAKKAAFLAEVARKLKLGRVRVLRERSEEIQLKGPIADCVTARAAGHFASLLKWSKAALEPGGQLVLWIGATDAKSVAHDPSYVWREPIPIPRSRNRVLLVGVPS
jgi:16S rRNA (guanine527-N7)-methyltransferase